MNVVSMVFKLLGTSKGDPVVVTQEISRKGKGSERETLYFINTQALYSYLYAIGWEYEDISHLRDSLSANKTCTYALKEVDYASGSN